MHVPVRTLLVAFLMLATGMHEVASADELTIYRCVAADGKLSLQDRPCPKDAHQDVREMTRPQDAPLHPPAPEVKPAPAPAAATEVRIVHVREPQPLYECRSYDGQSYLSQSGIPQSHFVPLWVQGLDPRTMNDGFVNVGGPAPAPSPHAGGSFAHPPGTWVEDRCIRLPQAEVCQRLRAREDELGTRIFNGQPSDRAVYERERQGLVEQMRSDCGSD